MDDPTGIPGAEPCAAGAERLSWTVHHVIETGSTNTDLMALAEAGTAADRTVLHADHQTAGRGRLDRRWDAPPGANLLASILFLDPPEVPSLLTHAVGRAVIDAAETLAARTVPLLGLKWPNDVLFDERKQAGFLAQRSVATGAVVVGFGLNVGWAPEGAASLADLGIDVDPVAVLDATLVHLARLLDGDVSARYRERLTTLGADVRVELPGGRTLLGTAVDVDPEGRLIVDTADGQVTLDVGDVVHLRRR